LILWVDDTDFDEDEDEEEVSVMTTVKQRGEAPFGRRFNVGPRDAMVKQINRTCIYVDSR
jgi:hypothetical protein